MRNFVENDREEFFGRIFEILKLSYKKPEIRGIERDFHNGRASSPKGLSQKYLSSICQERVLFRNSYEGCEILRLLPRWVPKRARWFLEWPTSGTRSKNRGGKREKGKKEREREKQGEKGKR